MQAVRLNAVLVRVVAWHNRHPLARRITAAQVHSVGEVVLPFASARATAGPAGAPGLPDVAELLDPSPGHDALTLPTDAAPGAFAAQLAAHRAAVAARQTQPADLPSETSLAQDGAAASGAPAAPDPLAPADPGPGPDAEPAPEVDPFAQAAADLALPIVTASFTPQPAEANADGHADLSLPLDTPLPPEITAPPATALAAARGNAATASRLPAWLTRALARLTGRQPGLPRLRPVFSRNFIWPMGPRQVAGWARRHGSLQSVAPVDWPRRLVETDARLLAAARSKGLAASVSLHLLTAAIGVDDRRIRLLMDAKGAILGPRAYSRGRLAIAGGLTAAALLAAGWDRLLPLLQSPATGPVLAETAASAPQATASRPAEPDPAPALAAAASTAAHAAQVPQADAAAAAQAADAAQADDHAPALAAQAPAHGAAASAVPPDVARNAGPHGQTGAAGASMPLPPPAAVAATAAEAAPIAAAHKPDGAPLGRIRPQLSAEDRAAARQQSAALRGMPMSASPTAGQAQPDANAPAPTIYAVVSRPARQREAAATSLALMRSAEKKLPQPLPSHGELMQNQGSWRAAWWPFASLADAERARVLLAGKGLKADVVEF
jgi:hypothetical protein